MGDQTSRLKILKAIIAFTIVSTGLHFTHNFVEVDNYPIDLASGAVVQVAILVFWPLFTAIGLLGYRLYSRQRYPLAHACLLGYAFFALTSLGHFLDGTPDIAPFWFLTIFTDALGGLAVLTFTVWSMRLTDRSAQPASA